MLLCKGYQALIVVRDLTKILISDFDEDCMTLLRDVEFPGAEPLWGMDIGRAGYTLGFNARIYGTCEAGILYHTSRFAGIILHALALACVLHPAVVHPEDEAVALSFH